MSNFAKLIPSLDATTRTSTFVQRLGPLESGLSMPSRRLPLMEISENDATSSPANATGSRRKSGRAVRAPAKLAFEPPSSQIGGSSGKRKRDGGDDEEDLENEDEEESEDSDEEEEESADEEEVRESKRKAKAARKPVAKKAKVNGTAPSTESAAVKLPNRAKKARKVAIADKNAGGLYAEIFTSGNTANDVAAEWLRRYEADNTDSMTDLVNCILKCTGCDLKVTEDDINDPDNVTGKVEDLQETFKQQNVSDYPLISKAKSSHAFRQSLTDFFQALVATMHQSAVLYDDIALIENIHLWVTTMSSSTLRPFRHTATVVALACATGLCSVAKDQAESTAQTLRQLETERKKKNPNGGRMTQFQEKVELGNQRQETCENTIRDFFDTVFVHRYRDVDPKIRTDCVEALGHWIQILPRIFFEGAYLRYLGWLLSDQNGPTRHEVLKQLDKIMKGKDNIAGLRHFIERFRERIVEMATRDAEISVRVSAVDLLDKIRANGVLEPNDIDAVGKLIFDSEPRVRKAVVSFFAENINDLYESKIEEAGGEEALDEAFTLDDENYENPSSGWIRLKCLAEMLLSYDAEEEDGDDQANIGDETLNTTGFQSRYSMAAEVLFDHMPEVSNWETLAGYLMFDHSKARRSGTGADLLNAFKLEEREEVILLDVLNTAVKLSLTQPESHEQFKDKSKKKITSKLEAKEAQATIARKLATLLPQLLKKFGASPKTAIAVLRLEHVLNLEVFQELRQDSTAYSDLLYEIKSKFKGHADQAVLKEASVALLHAQEFEDLQETTDEQINSLWDDTLDDFRKRFPKTPHMAVRGDMKVEHLVDLTNVVTRISKLASINNPVDRFETVPSLKSMKGIQKIPKAAIDMILELVGRGGLEEADPEIDDDEDRLVSASCQSALFYFMWKTRALKQASSSSGSISAKDIEQIKERLEVFSSRLVLTISSRGGMDDLRLFATGTLLDLFTLFSIFGSKSISASGEAHTNPSSINAQLQPLARHIAPEVQQELTSILTGAEKQYAKKARKNLESPADDDEPEDVDSEPEDEEEEDDQLSPAERQAETLKAERQLCELTSKLIVAIFAGVVDTTGPLKGKLRTRLVRNRHKLGQNFSKIVTHLDEPKKVVQKAKPKAVAPSAPPAGAKNAVKSSERVDEEEDEEDENPFAEDEPEEGTAEDLRRRELLDDEPPASVDEEGDVAMDGEDDDILGD